MLFRHSIDNISSVLLDFAKTVFSSCRPCWTRTCLCRQASHEKVRHGEETVTKVQDVRQKRGRDNNKRPRCKTEKTEQGRDNCKSPRCELRNENPPVEEMYKESSDIGWVELLRAFLNNY